MIPYKKTGFDKLTEEEKKVFDTLATEYSPKLERSIKNIQEINIRLKEYRTGGKRRKFSFQAKIIIPGKMIEAEATEWDLAVTLHQLYKKIIDQAEKNFRVSDQHKKPRRK